MKNLKTLITAFCLTLFHTANLKAQDDPNVGIYADGVKVTELTCYTFKVLTLVLPYNPNYSQYDKFRIGLNVGPSSQYGIISNTSFMSKNVKGKYIVYDLYIDKSEYGIFPTASSPTTRGFLAYYKGNQVVEALFSFAGMTVDGYTEEFEQGCNCIKKNPKYTYESIGKISVGLKNTTKMSGFKYPHEKLVDMSQLCIHNGAKVDLNNLNASSVNNGSGSVINNTPNSVNETKATNDNTSSFPSTPNAKALKPLDKNKTGYFSEKAGSKIIREGYKKGDDMNGEVRMYDDEGRLEHIYTYINNEANGYESEYDPKTGNIITSGNNKSGIKEGEWKRYKDGKAVGTDTYVNGEKQ